MTAQAKIEPPALAKMRDPFPSNAVSKLPKETKAQIEERKRDRSAMVWKCKECGGTHHKNATHLDYVGHAALTDRLLDVDLEWSWEPVSFGPDGLPVMDRNGGLWIRLTILGVTRLGYGDADGKQGGNAVKEAIGDALRNAAMRFGAALDLWHKGELHVAELSEDVPPTDNGRRNTNIIDDAQLAHIQMLIEQSGMNLKDFCDSMKISAVRFLPSAKFGKVCDRLKEIIAERSAMDQSHKSELDYIDADSVPF